jgi:hypothetical protein
VKLVEILNIALLVMKCNLYKGLPVLSAWISQDGHYSFAEFRCPLEKEKAFALA